MPRTLASKKSIPLPRASHKLVIRVAHPEPLSAPSPTLTRGTLQRHTRLHPPRSSAPKPEAGIFFLGTTRPTKNPASNTPKVIPRTTIPPSPIRGSSLPGKPVSVHARAGKKHVSEHIISLRTSSAPTPPPIHDFAIPPGANLLTHHNTEHRRILPTRHGRRHHHTRVTLHALACICLVTVTAISPFRIADHIHTLTIQAQTLAQSSAESSALAKQAQTAIATNDIQGLMHVLPTLTTQAQELSRTLTSATGGSEYLLVMIPGFSGPSKQVIAANTIARELSAITDTLDSLSRAQTAPLTQSLRNLRDRAIALRPRLLTIKTASVTLDPSTLGGTYRKPIEQAKTMLGEFVDQGSRIIDGLDLLGQVFTDPVKRRYMLIFQNNHELRATGGFMGSIAYIDIVRGKITRIETPPGGIYDIAGQTMTRTLPPEALRLLSSKFELQDANWFVDFPTSAQKIISFQNQSGNPTIDGVIAVTATHVQQLIALTGPITSETGETLSAETFFDILQDRTTTQPGKEKTKIAAFFTPLLGQLLSTDATNLAMLAGWVKSGISTRAIQAYFVTPSRQALAYSADISGALPRPSPHDFLSITHSNIGGQKTDAVVDTSYDLSTSLGTGSANHTLTITKTHRGVAGTLNYGASNIDYVRIMVPAGSLLTSAQGFEAPKEFLFDAPLVGTTPDPDVIRIEQAPQSGAGGLRITSEYGYTVFGGWIQTRPGKSTSVTLTYTTPGQGITASTTHPYTLTVRKQPGLERAQFTAHLSAPPGWTMRNASDLSTPLDFTHDLEFDTLLEYGTVIHPSS